MRKLRLSELRKTYEVLNMLDTDVPKSLLVHLSGLIQEKEQEQKLKKENKKAGTNRIIASRIRKLKVIKGDGILIKEKSNMFTFMHAIVDAGIAEVSNLNIQLAKQNIVILDSTEKKKLIKGYKRVGDNAFIRKIDSFETQFRILNTVNRQLNLHWTIGY